MLAFEKITDKDIHIANIYESETSDKIVQEIWYTHKFSGDSEIVNDDVLSLLEEEKITIQKDHNLTLEEYKRLCDDIPRGTHSWFDLDERRTLRRFVKPL